MWEFLTWPRPWFEHVLYFRCSGLRHAHFLHSPTFFPIASSNWKFWTGEIRREGTTLGRHRNVVEAENQLLHSPELYMCSLSFCVRKSCADPSSPSLCIVPPPQCVYTLHIFFQCSAILNETRRINYRRARCMKETTYVATAITSKHPTNTEQIQNMRKLFFLLDAQAQL